MTFAEAIEHMKRGALIREKGSPLWSWRGTSGRCYYGLKRDHPLQFRDSFLCSEVFGDDDWEVKEESEAKDGE